uniref:Uncharacterized protein n=1 Tax=viral metagenome TaxID=1070528 RepID=A0A6C0CG98_9ZZZZ
MNLKKFKLDCYNKIIEDYSNNHDLYMFFLYPLIFKLKKQDIKNYNYSIFLKLKKKQPISFNEYNVIKKYTKKNLDKDIRSTIKCIFWSDYIDKNNIYAIYYLKKHLSTKKQTPMNLINLLYRLLTNAPTKISGGMFDDTRKYLSNKAKNFGNKVISNVKNNLRILKEKVTNKNSDSPPPQSQDVDIEISEIKNSEQNKPQSQYSIFLDILEELNKIMPIAYSMNSSDPHITDYNKKTKNWTKEYRDGLLRNFDKDKLKFLFNYKDSSLPSSDKSRLDFFKQYYTDGYNSLIGLKMDISDLIIKEGGSSKIINVKLQLLLNYIISHISSKKIFIYKKKS